jgi:hypothetical protein
VLLVTLAIGGFVWAIVQATAGPRDATHAFLRDARKGDWDAAYDRMSPGYHDRVKRADFEADIRAEVPDAADSDDATFSSTSISGNVACLSGSLSPGGDSVFVQLYETRGDKWLIERISSHPTSGCFYD